uniref:Uncharacterized protein n=1 Tax=Setaria italica TaxID=4555 RepID=K3YFS5_SETIT
MITDGRMDGDSPSCSMAPPMPSSPPCLWDPQSGRAPCCSGIARL